MSPRSTGRGDVPASGGALDPRQFPILVDFLRGYLHEDWVEEHGSLEAAVAAFARDAAPDERATLAAEWDKLAEALAGRPFAALRRALTVDLRGRWTPSKPAEIAQLGAAIRRAVTER